MAVSLFLILLSGAVAGAYPTAYKGDLSVSLDRTQYAAGDPLHATVQVTNTGSVPIVNGYVVVELVRGCETPVYPSQQSNCDNVFHETIINNITLGGGRSETIDFNYALPDDLKSGTYRIDAQDISTRARK